MGLDFNGIRFLLHERRKGIKFDAMATIGRQSLLARPWMLTELGKRNQLDWNARVAESLCQTGFADDVLTQIGAAQLDSFDYSDYENATVVHDFNLPLPEKFHNRYDVVLDGGSLEHAFNFPQAIANSLNMVKVGGHYLAVTPANNLFGHGFYQFSAELYFRVLGSSNGFENTEVYIAEHCLDAPFFRVVDPSVVKERVIMTNRVPALMFVSSQRTSLTDILASAPQQSDYVSTWEAHLNTDKGGGTRNRRSTHQKQFIATHIPFPLRKLIEGLRGKFTTKTPTLSTPRFFQKCDF